MVEERKGKLMTDFFDTDHDISLDVTIRVLNKEIQWCYQNPKTEIVSAQYREGFIKGLKQAKQIIIAAAVAQHEGEKAMDELTRYLLTTIQHALRCMKDGKDVQAALILDGALQAVFPKPVSKRALEWGAELAREYYAGLSEKEDGEVK
jgi:hypothetical protein